MRLEAEDSSLRVRALSNNTLHDLELRWPRATATSEGAPRTLRRIPCNISFYSTVPAEAGKRATLNPKP